jgi:hypothetical protein
MFKIPSQAIVTIKGNVINVATPFDNDKTINKPIQTLGNDNKNKLKSMFKAFGDAYFTHRTCPNQ